MGPGEFISVTAEQVRRLGGGNAALIWSRINFICQVPGAGRIEDESGRWWVTSLAALAEDVGLTYRAARTAIDSMVKSGDLEVMQPEDGAWDRSKAYRSVHPVSAGRAHLPQTADAFAANGKCIGQIRQMHLPETADLPYIEELKDMCAIEDDRTDVSEICETLRDRMIANGCRTPTITTRWRTDARLLLDRDKVTLPAAIAVLEWSQRSEFWKANIQSPAKLRKQFDTLRLQMAREGVQMPATATETDGWLRECWKTGNVREIETRTGLRFDAPDIPEDVTDVRAFTLQARRDWITDRHNEIATRILRKDTA